MLSIVIPAYCEQEMVPVAAAQITELLSREKIPHELIFVDDGSKDATWAQIEAASKQHTAVRLSLIHI